ncbi:hypothetical protein BU25DRAFT_45798, partial [Macroventuria anomochaeta]
GTLKLLAALAEESTRSADPDYCEELADQIEQLLPVIARLRREAQFAPKSICATAGPSSGILNEHCDLPSPSSETASSRSRSVIRPSTQRCGSGSSSNKTSTQTGSLSTFDIVDRTKPEDEQRFLLSGKVPVVHSQTCPTGCPPVLQSELGDEGPDQAIALPRDDPFLNLDETDVPEFEDFMRELDQYSDPAKWCMTHGYATTGCN